jgi:hypothetical protein
VSKYNIFRSSVSGWEGMGSVETAPNKNLGGEGASDR